MESFDVSMDIDVSCLEERIEKYLKNNISNINDEEKTVKHPRLKEKTDSDRKKREFSCRI
ncbi:MAG: hypothetical protein PUE12_14735 [Oscillospiraceae bacterium]|nr:hypothetical protein [Oscillospiraceae bacterium]